jgi:hypothetical protein
MGPIAVIGRSPADCHAVEICDFIALVLAGGEVSAQRLEQRVRSAERLVFLTLGCCLCGVAALKRPEESYRKKLLSESGISLPIEQFPYELGYVFVMPSARGRRFSIDLTREAIAPVRAQGVFATSRTDNLGMHATLSKFQFVPVGNSYASTRGNHRLQLFVRQVEP